MQYLRHNKELHGVPAQMGGRKVEISVMIRTAEHPPIVVWDIGRLKRIHGECSTRLLHFQGISR
jgi:hypothetical protein